MEKQTTQSSIETLRKRVSPYTTQEYKTSVFSNFKSNIYYKYIAIIIITFVSLFVIRPKFIKSTYKDDNSKELQRLNIDKLMFSTIIISVIISLGLFFYYKHFRSSN
jgi:Na+/H+ antiporter NhaC